MDRENFISIALLLQINKNGPMTRENAWNPHSRIYLILPFTRLCALQMHRNERPQTWS
jgi:hypothetical protein